MSAFDDSSEQRLSRRDPEIILAELAPDTPRAPFLVAPRRRRRFWLPISLFVATWLSTLFAGSGGMAAVYFNLRLDLSHGMQYALAVMTVLICHEAGHFLQARRYGVYASYPFFIPMPITPLGTMGAVIAMEARMGDRRALFDIGITGPLAGLVPTLLFCAYGVYASELRPINHHPLANHFGEPLIFQWLAWLKYGNIPPGFEVCIGAVGFAGWVGLLITALNLIPIGQLDGGHVLYALLRQRAHQVATLLLLAATALVIWQWQELYGWAIMLILLMLMGPHHPPTADDDEPLGWGRMVLGWLTLAFIPLGFTPTPFLLEP